MARAFCLSEACRPYGKRCRRVACGMLVLVVFAMGRTWAAAPADIDAARRDMLHAILTSDSADEIDTQRRLCASGGMPASVANGRARISVSFPDAIDTCVTTLARASREHWLPALYRRLLSELGGDPGQLDRLPRAIGATVMGGTDRVPIGNGKLLVVSPALAFDAGFTVAYQGGDISKAGTPESAQLKVLSQSCLGQGQDTGTCFSLGYVYGSRTLVAAR